MPIEMEKTYDPQAHEARLYEAWESAGAFHAEIDPDKKPFSIAMPPPNITGQLHIGHAMDATLQDILTRYHRLLGDCTLWLPGTDHASIATEVKIIEALAKEGIDKRDLGREKFLERAWQWRETYGGRITKQLRKLGASCDWSRERFTMDEGCSQAVLDVFVRLYEEGLIFRGERIINWCPECRTALSDAEVEYEEREGHLWHIRYPGPDGHDIIVATTRPETMLGDTAVAVHPDDERYRDMIGKTAFLPLRERWIPIVADEYVEREFGTGAVKITPAHDPNDFEVAQRHNLPIDRVMNDDGTMGDMCGVYAGMKGLEARKAIVKALEEQGYLVKTETHVHNVGTCYRCHETVEPIVSQQWFVRMKPLAEPAIEAVRSGDIHFEPERFEKTYYNWMENIRDWCISRQLWWGHRIPAYYCDCGETIVAKARPERCPKCGSANLRQDEDVLDTWFSSALWPFSTLGWPEKTAELDYFYPTSVLVTGYDIIFFWVARMIFSGLHYMGEKPFDAVLFHGLVRDAQGRKMSKSLDNGVDPLEVIEQYGADALRFALTSGVSPGNDMRFSQEKLESARNFANKIWNAARFVLMNVDEARAIDPAMLSTADKWILTRSAACAREVAAHLDALDTGLAIQKLYDFIWSELCDWYLEFSKASLYGQDEGRKANVQAVLLRVLGDALTMLHPFMPFLTEAIYQSMPGAQGFLMCGAWPVGGETYPQEAATMEGVMDIVRAVRNLRVEMNVPASRKAHITLVCEAALADSFREAAGYFERLAYASGLTVVTDKALAPERSVAAVCQSGEAYLPLGDLIDFEKERARLAKEKANLEGEIARAAGKLGNAGFTAKAPAAVVEAEREKLAANRGLLEAVEARLAALAE